MQTLEGVLEAKFPFLPDFIIAREREVYVPGKFGRWKPHEAWNKQCEKDHVKLFKKARSVFKTLRKHVEMHTYAQWIEVEGDPAGIITSSQAEMDALLPVIEQEISANEHLGFQRNTIYLRFGHKAYHKGSAFAELCGLWNVPIERRFAIGDGHNDFGMLHQEFVGMAAAPINAHEDIKEFINERSGFIASKPASHGVIEALEHFFKEHL